MNTVQHLPRSAWALSCKQHKESISHRGRLGSQTGRGKNIKAVLSLLSFLFLLVSNQPRAAQNQAAHVAIAKTPQRPVHPWYHTWVTGPNGSTAIYPIGPTIRTQGEWEIINNNNNNNGNNNNNTSYRLVGV